MRALNACLGNNTFNLSLGRGVAEFSGCGESPTYIDHSERETPEPGIKLSALQVPDSHSRPAVDEPSAALSASVIPLANLSQPPDQREVAADRAEVR